MVDTQSKGHSRIGEEIDAYCGRCRLERTHRIVAQDADGTVRKVICGMCNSYRAYRPPKEDSKPRSTTPRVKSSKVVEEDFGLPSRNYNMRENFDVGEVIAHTTFGVGKVVAVRDFNKIDVKFSDGVKILLQNK